jgi:predicted nuclease of restriction endonuclease-like RecB superfamily
VAQYLDCCHIQWERNEKEFPVVIDGRHLKYVPDFYIPDLKVYLEVKGKWFTGKEHKTEEAVKQNELNWLIVYLHEWKRNKHILKDRLDSFKNILVFEKVV